MGEVGVRVLFVTNMWPDEERPWYGSFIHSQARSLGEIGLDVDVLAIRGYAGQAEYARGAAEMIRRSLRARPDVVHAHYGHSAVVARLGLGAPLVISYCGDDLLGTPAPGRPTQMTRASLLLARTFAQLARVASATITKSREMEQKLPAPVRGRNHVIPNGVDLDFFKPLDQAEARRRLGWPAHEKVALFVGNPANERKNHPLAQQAIARAAAHCPALRLRVASGIPPEEVPVWMSAADALVHPSWSEGSPNTVKEAMACALPVVATPAGDVSERLTGIPGCHVVAPDERAFAAAVLDAITHHPCAAARAAVSELGIEGVAHRVAAVYASVLER